VDATEKINEKEIWGRVLVGLAVSVNHICKIGFTCAFVFFIHQAK